MSEILLIGNPSRRKGKKKRGRKMSALQRKYFGKRARASNPRRRRRHKRSAVGYTVGSAPIRRRKMNPHRRRRHHHVMRRRRHRNPSFRGALGSAVPMLKSGLIGASGAIGLDLLWGYGKGYLPASIAGSAIAQYAAKLAGAILVGMVGNKILRGRGREMAVGATTVVLHDALKAQLTASFPTLQLGEYLSYGPAVGTMKRAGRLLSTGMSGTMGEYLNGLPGQIDNSTMEYNGGDYSADGMSGY
jgi:hypothetical protein